MKLEDSEMLRAAQSYMVLVEKLGGQTTVLPAAFQEALDRVARDFPDYTQDSPNLPTINRAMEVISRWLERVADKDPALFQTFLNKINQAQTPKKPAVKLPKPAAKSEPNKK